MKRTKEHRDRITRGESPSPRQLYEMQFNYMEMVCF